MKKKVLSTILAVIAVFALILAGAENMDGSCNLLWSLSCLAAAAVCGLLYGRLNGIKVFD